MAANPEILHTADIPEAESEVQDALIARLQADAKPKAKRGRPRKGAKEESESAPSDRPIKAQHPRKTVIQQERVLRALEKSPRSVTWREVQKYAEVHSFEAIDFLVTVLRDPLSKIADRLRATEMLLNRGLGKEVELLKMELNANPGGENPDTPRQSQVLLIGDQKVVF